MITSVVFNPVQTTPYSLLYKISGWECYQFNYIPLDFIFFTEKHELLFFYCLGKGELALLVEMPKLLFHGILIGTYSSIDKDCCIRCVEESLLLEPNVAFQEVLIIWLS